MPSDGEAEIWLARSSLLVTDARGRHVDLPDTVRVYLIAGTQHGGGRGGHCVASLNAAGSLGSFLSLSAGGPGSDRDSTMVGVEEVSRSIESSRRGERAAEYLEGLTSSHRRLRPDWRTDRQCR